MPLLLHTVRANRWFRADALRWLQDGDVPADPLGDLKTVDNRLSVWEVLEDRSNVERIVRAVVVGRDKIADAGYILFDSALLAAAGIGYEEKGGTTPDKEANVWHRDLVDLSGNKLVALAKALLESGSTDTMLKKRLRELIEQGIQTKQLPERLKKKLVEQ